MERPDEGLLRWRQIGAGTNAPLDLELALEEVKNESPLKEVEEVVITGDWHGDYTWARKVLSAAKAKNISTVLQLGDFGLWPRGDAYLDAVSRLCQKLDMTVLWLDGNHEDFNQLENYPLVGVSGGVAFKDSAAENIITLRPIRKRIWHAPRGTVFSWHGKKWMMVGGATSLDKAVRTANIDWWPQEVLTAEEVENINEKADVLLTHDCPAMVPLYFPPPPSFWKDEDLALANMHRERMQELVEKVQPSHLFHGHLHRAYQKEIETLWGSTLVTGLDCNGSSYGHSIRVNTATLEQELL